MAPEPIHRERESLAHTQRCLVIVIKLRDHHHQHLAVSQPTSGVRCLVIVVKLRVELSGGARAHRERERERDGSARTHIQRESLAHERCELSGGARLH